MSLSPKQLEKLIERSELSEGELVTLLKQGHKKVRFSNIKHDFGSKHIKIGVVSDTHIGSKHFNQGAFEASVEAFKEVDAIYHAGDIVEGMSGREGHIYELDCIGYSAQLKKAEELLRAYTKPFYFITGNHDLWGVKKANGGLFIGQEIERRVPNCHHIGDLEADLTLGNELKLKLTHYGQTAYALSYSGQKLINGLEGGTKPHLWINGHLHKAIFMNYRNVHFAEGGTLQNQSEFMRMKGSPSMVGFWIFDIRYSKNGLKSIEPKWFPYYGKP